MGDYEDYKKENKILATLTFENNVLFSDVKKVLEPLDENGLQVMVLHEEEYMSFAISPKQSGDKNK